MMLELLAQTNWVRPLFVAITVGSDNYMNLGDNFIQEGLVNRITPFNTTKCIRMDTEKTYNMLMNKFKFGGLETPGLYLDETVMRMCYTHRRLFGELAKNLLAARPDLLEECLAKVEERIADLETFVGGVCLIGELSSRSEARIISTGELLSSTIISYAFNAADISCHWIDARRMITTDDNYLNAASDMGRSNFCIVNAPYYVLFFIVCGNYYRDRYIF